LKLLADFIFEQRHSPAVADRRYNQTRASEMLRGNFIF
jgi:hypothetical protein